MLQRILLLSDLHICPRPIAGLDPWARFEAALTRALSDHPDADALALTGDLTHDGDAESYERLAARLASVPIPMLPMLGNHDDRAAFLAAFPGAPRTPSGHVQAVMDLPGVRVIALDSLDPGEPRHSGALCADRIAWLDDALAGREGRTPLVLVHHPPMPVGFPGMDRIRLRDGGALLDRLRPHGAHLICGHVHRTISGVASGVPYAVLKSTCDQAPLDLGEADTAASVDEPGAYALALAGPDGVTVHAQDILPPRPIHRIAGSD